MRMCAASLRRGGRRLRQYTSDSYVLHVQALTSANSVLCCQLCVAVFVCGCHLRCAWGALGVRLPSEWRAACILCVQARASRLRLQGDHHVHHPTQGAGGVSRGPRGATSATVNGVRSTAARGAATQGSAVCRRPPSVRSGAEPEKSVPNEPVQDFFTETQTRTLRWMQAGCCVPVLLSTLYSVLGNC